MTVPTMAPSDVAAQLDALRIDGAAPAPRASAGAPSAALAGMDDVLDALREVVVWPLRYAAEGAALGVRWPRGVLLHGPPGCGKSAAAAAVAAEAGALVLPLHAASVFGAHVGESERRLREAWAGAEAAAARGAAVVLLLEDVDALCPRRDARAPHEARVVGQLLTLLDGAAAKGAAARAAAAAAAASSAAGAPPPRRGHLAVVATTSRPGALDPALRRPGRLDREVGVAVPARDARAAILAAAARALPLARGVDLRALAGRCHGYTGADLAALAREAGTRAIAAAAARQQGPAPAAVEVTAADFEAARARVGPSVARGAAAEPAPASWADVGGLGAVVVRLRRAVEWPLARRAAFARLGLRPPRGVLLHGPPGCAKTTLARAAAAASGATFIHITGAQAYSMYVGEGEALVRDAFRRARLAAPAIVFLDELDTLVGRRAAASAASARADGSSSARGSDASARLLATLLTEMDGLEAATGVLVLAATNRPAAVDAALLRPGRFDVLLHVPPPDAAGRAEALAVHARRLPLGADVDIESIAARAERYTGAELAAVCREAALAAVREAGGADAVCARHFDAALAAVRPALTEADLARYAAWPPRRGGGGGRGGGGAAAAAAGGGG